MGLYVSRGRSPRPKGSATPSSASPGGGGDDRVTESIQRIGERRESAEPKNLKERSRTKQRRASRT